MPTVLISWIRPVQKSGWGMARCPIRTKLSQPCFRGIASALSSLEYVKQGYSPGMAWPGNGPLFSGSGSWTFAMVILMESHPGSFMGIQGARAWANPCCLAVTSILSPMRSKLLSIDFKSIESRIFIPFIIASSRKRPRQTNDRRFLTNNTMRCTGSIGGGDL